MNNPVFQSAEKFADATRRAGNFIAELSVSGFLQVARISTGQRLIYLADFPVLFE